MDNLIYLFQNFVITKPHDGKSNIFQLSLANYIRFSDFGPLMGCAINFDDQHEFFTHEIGDVVKYGPLTSKLITLDLSFT